MGEKMKTVEILFLAVAIMFVGIFIVNINEHNSKVLTKQQQCESAGWTWITQEGKCIMVKEFK
jgi:hypothetical protein